MAKRGFQGAVMRGFGARDHDAVVTGSELLAPKFLRVRLVSPTLFEDAEPAPTAWLRFWFPDPEKPEVEHQRAYTITEHDVDTGDFAVDFVLHEPAGPASLWALRAQPGDRVPVTSLGSSKFELPEELPAGYLLIGDAASIPGISGILETVPPEVSIELYLEQHDPSDRLIPLPEHPKLRTHWVPRSGAESLAAAIEARDWSDWYAWVAPEAGSLKHLRSRLRDEFGFPKSEMYPQAYWSHGRAMGKRRAPEDPGAAAATAEATADPTADALPSPPPPADGSASPATPRRGSWRAQAGSRLLAPLRRTFLVAGTVQAIVTLIQLAPFVLLTEFARRLLEGAGADELWMLGIWAVALIGLGALLSSGLLLGLHVVDARFEHGLRRRLLAKLARVPLGWFDARTSGQVKQLVQDDTLALHYLITHAVPDAVAAVTAPIAVLVYLFIVDWRLALLLFLPVLVYIVTMWIMLVQSGAKTSAAMRWAERMNSEAGGYLDGQPVVRVFGGAAASTFRARLGEYIEFLNDWQRPFTKQKTVMDLATRPGTFLLLIAGFGTLFVATGSMQPVALLPFLFLGTSFGTKLLGIAYGLSGLRTGLLAAKRVQLALDEPELEVGRAEHATGGSGADGGGHDTGRGVGAVSISGGARPGAVEFDRVGFAYRPGVPVLENISLRLEPGTVTALVGPSGSGKSTLAALLARFHDPGTGAIRVGGSDLRDLTPDELYSRIGFVFQQAQLVQGTVRENLALARPELLDGSPAAEFEIEEAARAARIHDRILRLPEGYGTRLGPDAALSGGERQRLTIARAILADTPVLVLDEATAFADPESEYLVQRALSSLASGRTVLVIAHRLHTVVNADRIVVLDEGRISEQGSHEQLLAANGRYRDLWEAR